MDVKNLQKNSTTSLALRKGAAKSSTVLAHLDIITIDRILLSSFRTIRNPDIRTKVETPKLNVMTAEFLSGLDPDEIFATRENLEAAIRVIGGPASRRLPESLCVEIEQLLYLLELAVRQRSDIPDS